jgi:hypothetical protein
VRGAARKGGPYRDRISPISRRSVIGLILFPASLPPIYLSVTFFRLVIDVQTVPIQKHRCQQRWIGGWWDWWSLPRDPLAPKLTRPGLGLVRSRGGNRQATVSRSVCDSSEGFGPLKTRVLRAGWLARSLRRAWSFGVHANTSTQRKQEGDGGFRFVGRRSTRRKQVCGPAPRLTCWRRVLVFSRTNAEGSIPIRDGSDLAPARAAARTENINSIHPGEVERGRSLI